MSVRLPSTLQLLLSSGYFWHSLMIWFMIQYFYLFIIRIQQPPRKSNQSRDSNSQRTPSTLPLSLPFQIASPEERAAPFGISGYWLEDDLAVNHPIRTTVKEGKKAGVIAAIGR